MYRFSDAVRCAWAWRKLAVGLFAAIMMVAVAAVFMTTPKYESTAWILIDSGRVLQPDAVRETGIVSRSDQLIRTQASILQSENVIKRAIVSFGADRLYPENVDQTPDGAVASASVAVRGMLAVNPEANTDLLKVSFRHTVPTTAVQFTNELVKTYLERHATLYGNPDAAVFFGDQRKSYETELARASAALIDFAKRTGTYSVDDQQKLFLSRRDQTTAALAETQGKLTGSDAELASIRYQLSVLKSRITLPPEIFGQTGFGKGTGTGPVKSNDALWTDPPLLHVKLYQETAQKMVDANIEHAGLEGLLERQLGEVATIDAKLNNLATNEPEFSRLKRAVNDATANLNVYIRKLSEANTDNAWRSNESLSSVQIMQSAGEPTRSTPRPSLVLAFGIFLGLLVSGLGICIAELWFAPESDIVRTAQLQADEWVRQLRSVLADTEHAEIGIPTISHKGSVRQVAT